MGTIVIRVVPCGLVQAGADQVPAWNLVSVADDARCESDSCISIGLGIYDVAGTTDVGRPQVIFHLRP